MEALVSFAILALFLTITFAAFSQVLLEDRRADLSRHALALARSELDRIGIVEPLVPGQRSGTWEDGYTWQAEIKAAAARQSGALAGYWITMTVSPPKANRDAPAMSLTTFKLARMQR